MSIEVDGELEDYEITNNVFEKLIEPTSDSADLRDAYS